METKLMVAGVLVGFVGVGLSIIGLLIHSSFFLLLGLGLVTVTTIFSIHVSCREWDTSEE